MKQITSILLILGFLSCSNNQAEENKTETLSKEAVQKKLTDFELLSDFQKNIGAFKSDTFDLLNHSTEGGELIVFHTSEKDYIVLDFWLYGETGKLNTLYWTDRDENFQFVKRTDYEYDRPMYEPGLLVAETTFYYSYSDSTFKVFDQDRNLVQDSTILEKRDEIERFLKEMTKDITLVK